MEKVVLVSVKKKYDDYGFTKGWVAGLECINEHLDDGWIVKNDF